MCLPSRLALVKGTSQPSAHAGECLCRHSSEHGPCLHPSKCCSTVLCKSHHAQAEAETCGQILPHTLHIAPASGVQGPGLHAHTCRPSWVPPQPAGATISRQARLHACGLLQRHQTLCSGKHSPHSKEGGLRLKAASAAHGPNSKTNSAAPLPCRLRGGQ